MVYWQLEIKLKKLKKFNLVRQLMHGALFHHGPEFEWQRAVTLHNKRDGASSQFFLWFESFLFLHFGNVIFNSRNRMSQKKCFYFSKIVNSLCGCDADAAPTTSRLRLCISFSLASSRAPANLHAATASTVHTVLQKAKKILVKPINIEHWKIEFQSRIQMNVFTIHKQTLASKRCFNTRFGEFATAWRFSSRA